MFRNHLARVMTLGAALFLVGCNTSGRGGLCNTCGDDRPGLFSRFRTASRGEGVIVGGTGGECCDRGIVSGPYLPAAPAAVLPAPQPGTFVPGPQPGAPIPRIEENAKQNIYDYNKMNNRPGIKTTTDGRITKEGI